MAECSLGGNPLLGTGGGNEPGKGKDNQSWGYGEERTALMLEMNRDANLLWKHLLSINKGILPEALVETPTF